MDIIQIVIVSVSLVVHLEEFLAGNGRIPKLEECVLELNLLHSEVSSNL